jgi:RNA polymerase primary sigma factor
LFSFLPVAREAVALLREATAQGASFHHSRILDISTVDSEAEKRSIVAIANQNLRTIDLILRRCNERWSANDGLRASEACRAELVEGLARDRGKIATLLSEIAIRPAFFAKFFAQFGGDVATARALREGIDEAQDPKKRSKGVAALDGHLEASQESYQTLLERWDRANGAHSDYQVAKDILITRNIRLAISEAKRYANRGVPLEDLIQEATNGLLTAAEKFDPGRGCRFTTYATPWMRQSILRSIDFTARTVRMPGPVLGAIRKIDDFRVDFRGSHGRNPTPEEIAEGVETTRSNARITADFVWSNQAMSHPIMSLESRDGEPATGIRMRESIEAKGDSPALEVENKLEAEERRRDIERLLAEKLDERQRVIIRLRFGLDGEKPQTLREIGETLGITRERVRQVEKQAMDILKASEWPAVYERGRG